MSTSRPARAAICIVTDEHYFPPAVQLACSLRSQLPASAADIVVLTTAPSSIGEARRYADRIVFRALDPEAVARTAVEAGSHITRATYLKVTVADVLDGYERLLVLDVDVAVHAPHIAALLALDMRGHAVAAVLDVSFFIEEADADAPGRTYRAALGMASPETPYFNGGVLLIDVARWRADELGRRALAFAERHPERCRYVEQDALNAVLQGNWLPLSPRLELRRDLREQDLRFAGDRRHTEPWRRFLADSPWPGFIASQRRPGDWRTFIERRARARLGFPLRDRETFPHPKKLEYLFTTPFADIDQGIGPPILSPYRVAHPQ